MASKTFIRVAVHGEASRAEAEESALRNHRAAHPLWLSPEQREALDEDQLNSYNANAPRFMPEPRPVECQVTGVYRADDGSKLEIDTSDWSEAEAIAARDKIVVEF